MSVPMHLLPLSVKKIEVIAVVAARGDGTDRNPERTVVLYYSMDGEMLACYDPLNGPVDGFGPVSTQGVQ